MSDHGQVDPPGPLIGRGRAADVYDLGDGRVLRRNRNGASTEHEAAVMAHLFRHGYPVPEVHDASGPDLVMDRIDGPTMLDAFPRRPWKLRTFAKILADLHNQLESVPTNEMALPTLAGRAEVLIHGDLHPDNVMLTASGPIVIDWPNASLGPRGFDAAHTWVLMATSEVDTPLYLRWVQTSARQYFISRFLDGIDRRETEANLAAAAHHRLGDRNLRAGEADSIHRLLAAQGLE